MTVSRIQSVSAQQIDGLIMNEMKMVCETWGDEITLWLYIYSRIFENVNIITFVVCW